MHWLWLLLIVPGALLFGLLAFTAASVRRVEAALPPLGRFVDVPGARLHVVEKGQGPPVLLVHGLGGQLQHFTYALVDRLAEHHRVVAVDRPGSGYSVRAPGAAAGPNAQADVLAALIAALQLGQPVVAGHSLGGTIALALAQRHPRQVAALALIAPLTRAPASPPAAFASLAIAQAWLRPLVAWTVAVPTMIAARDRILPLVFGPDATPRDYGTRAGGLLGLRPSHFVATSTDLAALAGDLPGLVAGYPAMMLPVAVLFGRGDGVLDPALQGDGLVADLPGTRLTLIDGGHMLPLTAPGSTARFIAEVAARAPR